jgi:hypothetical protein
VIKLDKQQTVATIIVISSSLIYLIFALFYHFHYQNKYSYTAPAPACKTLTFTLQPIMEVFAHSKITHACHFKDTNSIPNLESQLFVKSQSQPIRRFDDNPLNIFINAYADLGVAKEAWIIEPIDYQGQWSLVYYDSQSGRSQRSILNHIGAIRILVDGQGYVWGEGQNGEVIELSLIKKTWVSQDKKYLFI